MVGGGKLKAQKPNPRGYVVLIFAENPCYVSVIELDSAEADALVIQLDWAQGTWTALKGTKSTLRTQPVKIGEARLYDERGQRNHEGVIGIFDRRDAQHLSSMISAGRQATEAEHTTDAEYA